MGHRKKGPMLEPVLENYMGPPICYNTPGSRRTSTAKVAPASEPATHESKLASVRKSLMNPVNVFGKLRDRYIKALNEMSLGGDLASVAGYHGCVAGMEHSGVVEQQYHRTTAAREKEILALREVLAARQRQSSELAADQSSDEEENPGSFTHHHHHQYKSVR